jgi:hypothetical protein
MLFSCCSRAWGLRPRPAPIGLPLSNTPRSVCVNCAFRKGMSYCGTDREFSANFDRQASATNSVLFLGLSPTKANKTVSLFVSFHRGAT